MKRRVGETAMRCPLWQNPQEGVPRALLVEHLAGFLWRPGGNPPRAFGAGCDKRGRIGSTATYRAKVAGHG